MSEREPITAELRMSMTHVDGHRIPMVELGMGEFTHRCDAIDAVHAGLERENAELRAKLDNMGESMHETDAWKLGYDEGFASADDWMADNEDAMEEHGWVRKDKEHIISHATIEVTPHIDWSRMADELNEFVEIVRGIAGGAE